MKPEQIYFENKRILKAMLYTNMTLASGSEDEGCVIDLCFKYASRRKTSVV